jgi:hypothetical protein
VRAWLSEELYDLETDCCEMDNLADRPDVAGIKADLARRLHSWMEDTDDPLLRGPIPAPEGASLDTPFPPLARG